MSTDTKVMTRQDIITTIQNTSPERIGILDFVKDRFIRNYKACNPGGLEMAELMYHRQLVHFNQIIGGSDKLKQADRFSLYACFVTAAANGYSLDPADNTVYLIPKGGKAHLWRQAGAHVHRLIRSNQIRHAEQVQLVYKGDNFVASKGRVIKHEQNFMGEEFIAAYQEFVLPDGQSRYFIYRPSDWFAWRSKSDVPNGPNWNFKGTEQPEPGFLKTKITKHAATEKVWATGMQPITPDTFEDVEIESDDIPSDVPVTMPMASGISDLPASAPATATIPASTPATTPTGPVKTSASKDDDDDNF